MSAASHRHFVKLACQYHRSSQEIGLQALPNRTRHLVRAKACLCAYLAYSPHHLRDYGRNHDLSSKLMRAQNTAYHMSVETRQILWTHPTKLLDPCHRHETSVETIHPRSVVDSCSLLAFILRRLRNRSMRLKAYSLDFLSDPPCKSLSNQSNRLQSR